MALSRHEQLVLDELEKSLSREDPQFEKSLNASKVYERQRRNLCWAVVAFLLGLAIMASFFANLMVLGLVGLCVMYGSTFIIERSMRIMHRTRTSKHPNQ